MATSGGLPSIEQGKPLDVPLDEPADPSKTWKTLAHSDSTTSIDADENILANRVDSVALAHKRLDKLKKASDSTAVAKKQTGKSGSDDALDGEDAAAADCEGCDAAAASRAEAPPKRGSPSLGAGFKRLAGAVKSKLGKQSPKASAEPAPAQTQGSSSRVRFSIDDQQAAS